jgi:hypothetical protein
MHCIEKQRRGMRMEGELEENGKTTYSGCTTKR